MFLAYSIYQRSLHGYNTSADLSALHVQTACEQSQTHLTPTNASSQPVTLGDVKALL